MLCVAKISAPAQDCILEEKLAIALISATTCASGSRAGLFPPRLVRAQCCCCTCTCVHAFDVFHLLCQSYATHARQALSTVDVGQVSAAVISDGSVNPATQELANIGHENGNAARGFRRFVARGHLLHGLSIYIYIYIYIYLQVRF